MCGACGGPCQPPPRTSAGYSPGFPGAGLRSPGVQYDRGPNRLAGAQDSLRRQALGVPYAVTVIVARKDGQLLVNLGEHEWVDSGLSAGIRRVAVPSRTGGTAYGIWREYQLDNRSGVVDQRLAGTEPAAAPVAP